MCGRQLDPSPAEEKAGASRAIRCTACLRSRALSIVQTRRARLPSREGESLPDSVDRDEQRRVSMRSWGS